MMNAYWEKISLFGARKPFLFRPAPISPSARGPPSGKLLHFLNLFISFFNFFLTLEIRYKNTDENEFVV